MKTLLKWPGGKESELHIIEKYIPTYNGKYVEPFVGGGALYFKIENKSCYINDLSVELITFYNCVKNQDEDFLNLLNLMNSEFCQLGNLIDEMPNEILDLYLSKISVSDFLSTHADFFSKIALHNNAIFIKELNKNLSSKIKRSQKLEQEKAQLPNIDRLSNIEAALKSAYYMYIRFIFNHKDQYPLGMQSALFFFIREYCYSSMFRYNNNGEFNVPYGGISYNKKNFQKKIDYLSSAELIKKLKNTQISRLDFEEYLNNLDLTEEDFLFLDPPYDTDFSTYANNKFNQNDQIRLRNFLKNTKAKSLLVIKNTEFINELYSDKNFFINCFDKKYLVSFKSRNNQRAEHLIITNYQINLE